MEERERRIPADQLRPPTWWEQWLGDVLSQTLGLLICVLVSLAAWQWWRGTSHHVAALPLMFVAALSGLIGFYFLIAGVIGVFRRNQTASIDQQGQALNEWDVSALIRPSQSRPHGQ